MPFTPMASFFVRVLMKNCVFKCPNYRACSPFCSGFYWYTFSFCITLSTWVSNSEENVKIMQTLFEDKQEVMEITIEKLSKHLQDALPKQGSEIEQGERMAVVNLTSEADIRCAYLYDVVIHDLLGSLPEDRQAKHTVCAYQCLSTSRAAISVRSESRTHPLSMTPTGGSFGSLSCDPMGEAKSAPAKLGRTENGSPESSSPKKKVKVIDLTDL